MKNNYHQTIIVVHLMTYIHVQLTLFICYLFRVYKNMILKKGNKKNKNYFYNTKKKKKKKKNQNKRYKCAKNRIK